MFALSKTRTPIVCVVFAGVKGVVTDNDTAEPIEGALVSLAGQPVPPNPSSTTSLGEYWKLLPEGTFKLYVRFTYKSSVI